MKRRAPIQGQSDATESKERGLSQLLELNMRLAKPPIKRAMSKRKNARYWHFDLHAGSGWNHEQKVMGSPIVFVNRIHRHELPYSAHFAEIDEGRATELAARPEIANRSGCKVHVGDNKELCQIIPDLISQHEQPGHALGSVFIDPSVPTNETPWTELQGVFQQCQKLDVIINFPANGMKRIGRDHKQYININQLPEIFDKEHWLVRQVVGKWQWCMVIGRNFPSGDWRSVGFEHWDSPMGQEIRDRAYYKKKEIDGIVAQSQLALNF